MQATIQLSQLSTSLRDTSRRMADLSPVLRAGRIVATAEVKSRFDSQQSATGSAWPPLKQSRPSGAGKPLLDTGLLRGSITGREDSQSITIGTAQIQARLHQFGGAIAPKKGKFLAIPATIQAKRAGSPRRIQGLRPIVSRSGSGGVLVDESGVVQFYLSKGVKIPARPFLGWSAAFLQKFNQMLVNYILEGSL